MPANLTGTLTKLSNRFSKLVDVFKLDFMSSFCSQCNRYRDDSTKKMCDVCREKRRLSAAKLENSRKQNDLCTKCGNRLDRQGARCKKCLRKYRLNKTTPDYRCTECNKTPVNEPIEIHCKECAEKLETFLRLKKTFVFTHYGNKCDTCNITNTNCLIILNDDSTLEKLFELPDFDSIIQNEFPDSNKLRCLNCAYLSLKN